MEKIVMDTNQSIPGHEAFLPELRASKGTIISDTIGMAHFYMKGFGASSVSKVMCRSPGENRGRRKQHGEYKEQLTFRYSISNASEILKNLLENQNIQLCKPEFKGNLFSKDPDDNKFVNVLLLLILIGS